MVRNVLVVLFGVIIAAGSVGCSRTKGRTIDIDQGEYYGEDEFAALSNKEKAAYCDALETKRNQMQASLDDKQEDLAATKKRIDSLRNQITPVEKEILRVESDIRTLSAQVAQYEALPRQYKVVAGDCLSIIAEKDEVYADWTKWPRIYRANLDKIEDPVWIYPDTTLAIPRDLPTQHRVAPYETLEIIAGYWEVYGDPAEWVRLFEANKDKVRDPNELEPDILLVIPR
ncbi:MAG: LysM peptidoglycan-binding domain-containing protein [Candidatus Krumholzibacteria bacterium]|nr:LysM peptidoglycan-binding domain-containing protein [Candidatus Krumholzibacteria bacterium]MDH4336294.1 LysM peptidoglycan-binding domain-containing protein [Candidatus Krumholzibacteria bacterium]MDH5269667.1 LysM peptidoglycan-binding domain-containing protein [Candidatus Krumholzibacteria bacterium]MDH5627280.1 LysM peptidoglycan-binding domain-containing protein [Candidatus Krumholzibacteria bacterium]